MNPATIRASIVLAVAGIFKEMQPTLKGPKGERGDRGYRGENGPKGDQGLQGPQGPKGKDGKDGKDGVNGKDGRNGLIGPRGEKGDQGPPGESGVFNEEELLERLRGRFSFWGSAGNGIGALMGASGPGHAPGAVPDPGSTAGTSKFLREDATWQTISTGITIGTTAIASGTSNSLLFENSSHVVSESSGGTYDGISMTLAAGTITTDIAPLRLTETRNNAGTTFNGFTYTITETASAAGSLAMQILGGSSGAVNLFKVSKTGGLTFPSDCNSGGNVVAGASAFFAWSGRALVWSDSTENVRLTNNAGTSFGLLQFGGTSSSFPAIKRSTTSLQVRLADDSAFSDFALRNLSIGSTLAANQTDGFINIAGAAGPATGTPNNTTGIPLYYDTTANKLMAYNGGWKTLATAFA